MIYITGDLHGEIDIHKLRKNRWKEGQSLTKNDYLIICGDFGLIWYEGEKSKHDKWWLNWLNDQPWTTLFVDGNHENFNLLNSYPVTEWHGGKVHQIEDSIYHLMRGQIYTLDNKKVFTFGGAASHDRERRVENISWWKAEQPTIKEVEEAISNLKKAECKVDIIITHDACKQMTDAYGFSNDIDFYNVYGTEYRDCRSVLKYIDEFVQYKAWFMGHLHHDNLLIDTEKEEPRTNILLYDKIIKYGSTQELLELYKNK